MKPKILIDNFTVGGEGAWKAGAQALTVGRSSSPMRKSVFKIGLAGVSDYLPWLVGWLTCLAHAT